MNASSGDQATPLYQCPVCGARLGAETAKPPYNARCRRCGYYLWCRKRMVGDVVVLDALPGGIPADVERLADSLAATEAPRVVLDLSRLDLLGSLYLARLLVLHRRIQRDKGRLILCCLHPMVVEALTFTKLDSIFEVAADQEAALASF